MLVFFLYYDSKPDFGHRVALSNVAGFKKYQHTRKARRIFAQYAVLRLSRELCSSSVRLDVGTLSRGALEQHHSPRPQKHATPRQ